MTISGTVADTNDNWLALILQINDLSVESDTCFFTKEMPLREHFPIHNSNVNLSSVALEENSMVHFQFARNPHFKGEVVPTIYNHPLKHPNICSIDFRQYQSIRPFVRSPVTAYTIDRFISIRYNSISEFRGVNWMLSAYKIRIQSVFSQ